MTYDELLQTPEYWTTKIQLELFDKVEKYLEDNKLSRADFAKQIGVSKGYVTQILNGDFDHRISKLVELSLAIGYFPNIKFEEQQTKEEKKEDILKRAFSLLESIDHCGMAYQKGNDFQKANSYATFNFEKSEDKPALIA